MAYTQQGGLSFNPANLKQMGANYRKRFGAGSALGGMLSPGFSGAGFTGSPENIAQLTGGDYTNPRTGKVTANVGGPTWQEMDQTGGLTGYADAYAGAPTGVAPAGTAPAGGLHTGTGSLVGRGTGAPLNAAIAQYSAQGGLQGGQPPVGQEGGQPTVDQQAYTDPGTIESIYRNQLGREPDAAGLEFYQGLMDQGVSIEEIRKRIMQDAEGQKVQTQTESNLSQAYKNALGRDADPTGLQWYAAKIDSGEWTMQQALDHMYQSDERTVYEQGMTGYEQKQTEATDNANQVLEDSIEESTAPLDPYSESGQRAQKMLDDLAGTNGPEAQQAAYQAYNASPEVQVYLDEMREQQTRAAAATGQLGGGNMQTALAREAARIHQKGFQDYRAGLETTAAGGLMAGRDIADITSGTRRDIAQNLMDSGILDANRAWELAGQLAEDAYSGAQDLSELELQRAESVTNWMQQGATTIDSLIAGELGAISTIQTEWLSNLTQTERDFAELMVGIWAQNTNSGADTGESGSDFLGTLQNFIAGTELGEDVTGIFKGATE